MAAAAPPHERDVGDLSSLEREDEAGRRLVDELDDPTTALRLAGKRSTQRIPSGAAQPATVSAAADDVLPASEDPDNMNDDGTPAAAGVDERPAARRRADTKDAQISTDDPNRHTPAAVRRNRAVEAAGVQAGEGADWNDWSISRAMRLLRSPNQSIVMRTIRKLHVRLWHASSARLEDLLTMAGAPQAAIDKIKQIVDTCPVCRPWTHVGNRPVATLKLVTCFNDELQMDLLFWRAACPTRRRTTPDGEMRTVLHIICVCVRFSQGALLADRNLETILAAIVHVWFRVFGPPKRIVSDQEGALNSDAGRAWATRWNVELVLRPRKAHARMVERHNELLRSQLHRVEGQLAREGLALPPVATLDECFLAKNVMLSVHGVSPYQAVLGRTPNMLREFEPLSETAVDDEDSGIQGVSRNVNRLREAAIHSIVRGTAQDRVNRAMNSRTRPSAEVQDLVIGDSVDFHRDPPNKDMSGWSGPARVVDLSRQHEGTVGIEWQSRNFPCRLADLRRTVLYTCFFAARHDRDYAQVPLQVLVRFARYLYAWLGMYHIDRSRSCLPSCRN